MAAQNPNNFNVNNLQNNQNINANMNQNWNAYMNPFMYPYMNPNMMTPEQVQMMMRMQQQQFEMQKMQARQIGQILKKQKELVLRMKHDEESRKNEDLDIILFFNHNYEILPLTFKQKTLVAEALQTYIQQTNKQNVKFKFGAQELKTESGKALKEVEGLINGSEIIVQSQ